MLYNEWGSVDGDGNADGIIADRRESRRQAEYLLIFHFGIVVVCAFWYGWTETPAALAAQIVAVTWLILSGIRREIYLTHTLLLIVERRTQLLEQKVRDVQSTLDDGASRRF